MPGTIPANPAIYHITHVSNVAGILRDGCLWSDSERIGRSLVSTNIGHKHIKERRLRRDVTVAAGGKLGDYVPFYFCNRSVMLYVVSRGHQDYVGGQDEIVHLVSSVQAATRVNQPWAFTDRHAELGHALYYDRLADLSAVDWDVMPMPYWSESDVKEKRQAEFLVHNRFPWSAIEKIGVRDQAVAMKVRALLGGTAPPVEVQPGWYY
jgi:hypothetical protein